MMKLTAAGAACSLTALLVSFNAASLRAIDARQAEDRPVLRVSSELVVLHVNVTGRDRRPVADLPCDAFRIYENNRPQDLSICEPGTDPLALGLVVDSSTSMGRYRQLLAAAGGAFVRLGNPENDVFVMQFNERVLSALRDVDFTRDPDVVARAVRNMPTRGLTALHNAIDAAIEWAERSERLKKVVVLVSDGGDNASALSFEDVLRRAQQANVSFFAVALDDPTNMEADPKKLRRLARETGGLVFTPAGERQVNEAFERIAADLQTGYTLAYVSNNTEPAAAGYHAVRVAARSPKGERLVIRTRAGYIPSGGPHAGTP